VPTELSRTGVTHPRSHGRGRDPLRAHARPRQVPHWLGAEAFVAAAAVYGQVQDERLGARGGLRTARISTAAGLCMPSAQRIPRRAPGRTQQSTPGLDDAAVDAMWTLLLRPVCAKAGPGETTCSRGPGEGLPALRDAENWCRRCGSSTSTSRSLASPPPGGRAESADASRSPARKGPVRVSAPVLTRSGNRAPTAWHSRRRPYCPACSRISVTFTRSAVIGRGVACGQSASTRHARKDEVGMTPVAVFLSFAAVAAGLSLATSMGPA
jgi:hypothetical protein